MIERQVIRNNNAQFAFCLSEGEHFIPNSTKLYEKVLIINNKYPGHMDGTIKVIILMGHEIMTLL